MTALRAAPARDLESPEVNPATRDAFDRYVRLTEARIATELALGGAFPWPDTLTAGERDGTYAALRRGEIRIEHLTTRDQWKEIECPWGKIHHSWEQCPDRFGPRLIRSWDQQHGWTEIHPQAAHR
jgi:hypothetical protein